MPSVTLTVSAADAQRIQNAIASGKIPGLDPATATPKDLAILAIQQMIINFESQTIPPPITIT